MLPTYEPGRIEKIASRAFSKTMAGIPLGTGEKWALWFYCNEHPTFLMAKYCLKRKGESNG